MKVSKKNAHEQARKARNKYYREYRLRNPERTKAVQMRYWAKKAVQNETDK